MLPPWTAQDRHLCRDVTAEPCRKESDQEKRAELNGNLLFAVSFFQVGFWSIGLNIEEIVKFTSKSIRAEQEKGAASTYVSLTMMTEDKGKLKLFS